jgi:hypothetical protein
MEWELGLRGEGEVGLLGPEVGGEGRWGLEIRTSRGTAALWLSLWPLVSRAMSEGTRTRDPPPPRASLLGAGRRDAAARRVDSAQACRRADFGPKISCGITCLVLHTA